MNAERNRLIPRKHRENPVFFTVSDSFQIFANLQDIPGARS